MKMCEIARLPYVLESRIEADVDLARVTCDSRRSGPDTGFFALSGQKTDGHRFLDVARIAGAPALFVSDFEAFFRLAASNVAGLPLGRVAPALFRVEPGRAVLADLVAQLYGSPSERIELLGVTGTNGKATVTFLIAQTLAALGRPCGIIGGLGFHLPTGVLPSDRTTPEAPDIAEFLTRCIAENVGTIAMEVSSIGIHQERTRGLHFRAAAYTNFTQDHLDYHGTMEVYRSEKERLFAQYSSGGAVFNLDDPTVKELAGRIGSLHLGPLPVMTYGMNHPADLSVADLRLNADGTQGLLCHPEGEMPFKLTLPGVFNVSNWLAALALLRIAGHPLDAMVAAASKLIGAPGRMERVPVAGHVTVLVDYAHTPHALETVLSTLRPLTKGQLRVLFGCGGDRDRSKRPYMGAIAERLADRVVLTSDNPRSEDPGDILFAIRAGMRDAARALEVRDRREAIYAVLNESEPGDVVLLAGKGSEAYQEIQGKKLPFDDRDIVRAWSRERTGF